MFLAHRQKPLVCVSKDRISRSAHLQLDQTVPHCSPKLLQDMTNTTVRFTYIGIDGMSCQLVEHIATVSTVGTHRMVNICLSGQESNSKNSSSRGTWSLPLM